MGTRSVISSCDHLAQRGLPKNHSSRDGSAGTACKRMTVITDCPLLSVEGLNLCVVPPGSMEPPLENVVQVLQVDFTTGTCPRGYNVIHLSQVCRNCETPENDAAETVSDDSFFLDLTRVLESLLGYCEGGARHCLFRCAYLHTQRHTVQWDPTTPDGALLSMLADPSRDGGLVLSADPGAAPQLLAGREVDEARDAFLLTAALSGSSTADADGARENTTAVGPEDFLRKPVHVALEEHCSGMEDLETFNDDMLSAETSHTAAASLLARAEVTTSDDCHAPDSEDGAPAVAMAEVAAAVGHCGNDETTV